MGYKHCKINEQLGLLFQFPLWDTQELEIDLKLLIITFNSLYGILNDEENVILEEIKNFQFPLWDTEPPFGGD